MTKTLMLIGSLHHELLDAARRNTFFAGSWYSREEAVRRYGAGSGGTTALFSLLDALRIIMGQSIFVCHLRLGKQFRTNVLHSLTFCSPLNIGVLFHLCRTSQFAID